MTSAAAPGARTFAPVAARAHLWLLAAALIALWFVPINQLRVEWSINPQYAYGWVVPLLSLYLFAERWKNRPIPRPGHPGRSAWDHTAAALLFAFILLPARLIEEAAPDWRLVGWVLALAAVALSLEAVLFAGGRPWLRHFFFPICFFLVAVPWPVPFEHAVVQRLMHWVATLCVEALGWWGMPAIQQGNVIRISSGVVGVEEACSGVRSLQTTLMIALFLGELFRFPPWRRLILLAAGLTLAFACNVARALTLVYLYGTGGQQAFQRFHDAIGLTVLLLSLLGLAALSCLLRSRSASPPPAPQPQPLSPARSIPLPALIALIAWVATAEAGTELWYRLHDRKDAATTAWTVTFPAGQPGYHEIPIPDITEAVLRYNQGRAAGWVDLHGNQWVMFFLRWLPGRASVQLARSHGPEVCLPASGLILRTDLGVSSWQVGSLTLDAHSYIFSTQDNRLRYVFFCLAEDRQPGDGPASTRQRLTQARRLDAVLHGRRNRGQQVLEIVLSGPPGPTAARDAISAMLTDTLRPTPTN